MIPQLLKGQILNLRLEHDRDQPDKAVWKGSQNGVMSSKALFKFLSKEDNATDTSNWARIWKLNCLPKIRMFVWILLYGRLPTNEYRQHIGLTDDASCLRCQLAPESILHLLRPGLP